MYNNYSTRDGERTPVCFVSFLSVKPWMEGTHDIPYKNPYFFTTTEPNQLRFSPRCCHSVLTSCTHDRSKFRVKRGLFLHVRDFEKKGCFHKLVLEIEKSSFWAITRNWKKGVFFFWSLGSLFAIFFFWLRRELKVDQAKILPSRLDSHPANDLRRLASACVFNRIIELCTVHVDS